MSEMWDLIPSNREADELVVEGLVATTNEDGSTNVSPMGPIVDRSLSRFRLRPFPSSRTYRNLARTREGIFHVTDDVELLASAALGDAELPELTSIPCSGTMAISSACRWYALRVSSIDDSSQRIEIQCEVVGTDRLRDFVGWNRAQYAVVEAAILATRVEMIGAKAILEMMEPLAVIVRKTGGVVERKGFQVVLDKMTAIAQSD